MLDRTDELISETDTSPYKTTLGHSYYYHIITGIMYYSVESFYLLNPATDHDMLFPGELYVGAVLSSHG